jgi:hypothetical protein
MSESDRPSVLWRLVIAMAIAEALLWLKTTGGVQPPKAVLPTLLVLLASDRKGRSRRSTAIAVPLALTLVWVIAWQLGERGAWVAGAGAVATLVFVRRWWAER